MPCSILRQERIGRYCLMAVVKGGDGGAHPYHDRHSNHPSVGPADIDRSEPESAICSGHRHDDGLVMGSQPRGGVGTPAGDIRYDARSKKEMYATYLVLAHCLDMSLFLFLEKTVSSPRLLCVAEEIEENCRGHPSSIGVKRPSATLWSKGTARLCVNRVIESHWSVSERERQEV